MLIITARIAIVEISKNVEAMGAQIDAVMTTSQVEESVPTGCGYNI